MSTYPLMESVYFTYTDTGGSLKKLEHPRGSQFEYEGRHYQVIDAQPVPRFMDYGETPFTVRLRCRSVSLIEFMGER